MTLVIPWLALADQARVYPNNLTFSSPAEQEKYVRAWVEKRTGFDCNFKVTFYPGRYASEKGSILPVGDPTKYIPDSEVRPYTINYVEFHPMPDEYVRGCKPRSKFDSPRFNSEFSVGSEIPHIFAIIVQ